MIWLRLFWAVFMAGTVGYTFRRSWGWEHGKPAGMFSPDGGKETAVWVSPLILPIMMVWFCVLFVIFSGAQQGILRFLGLSLDIIVTFSLYYVLLLVVLPVLRRYFSARVCATMWLLPVFVFYQPHMLYGNAYTPMLIIYVPHIILHWLLYIWLVGFTLIFLWKIIAHVRFRHILMSKATSVTNAEILDIWKQELEKAEYRKPVRLVCSSSAIAPLSMGRTKRGRVTVLPNKSFSDNELRFIFRHEIRHLQRCDVDTKVFLAFCGALCWFNPLVWVAIRKASDDLELSCDEMVLERSDGTERKQYAELLLQTAGDSRGFTTCLSAAAGSLRYRLKNVVTIRKRWIGTFLLAVAMFGCVMCYGAAAVSSDRGTLREKVFPFGTTGWSIESIFFHDYGAGKSIGKWDEEKLLSYISTLKIETLNSANELNDDSSPRIDLRMNTSDSSKLLSLDDEKLVIWTLGTREKSYYVVRSDVDWDYIRSCAECSG